MDCNGKIGKRRYFDLKNLDDVMRLPSGAGDLMNGWINTPSWFNYLTFILVIMDLQLN